MGKLKKGLIRITYAVTGKNINYLPARLHLKGVNVYNYERFCENKCSVTIDASDRDKFFAICKNMCYNKKVTKSKGILSPLVKIFANIGFFVGVVGFVILSACFSTVVLDVKVEGSAKCFQSETLSVVERLGVKKYSLFKDVDYVEIENAVLSSNPRISFVTAYKRGNSLVVSAELSSGVTEPLSKNASDVVCEVDGVVEEISVLRGTALVKAGDSVKAGDVLVGAYLLGKDEQQHQTFTVARVKVLQNVEFEYGDTVVNDRAVELCYALSEFKLKTGEIASKSHKIIGDKIVITLTVRHVYFGGNS